MMPITEIPTRYERKLKAVSKDGPSQCIQYLLSSGITHRVDGPAEYYLRSDGGLYCEFWYYENLPHRYSGPSFMYYRSGFKGYHIHGKEVTVETNTWLSDMGYVWETMSDIEKWELELFMRCLG